MDPNEKEKGQMDYAWKYFALVADQRLRSFHFYCLLLVACIAGTGVAFLQRQGWELPVIMALAHVVLGTSFLLLDIRGHSLVLDAKEALKVAEASFDEAFRVMTKDDNPTNRRLKERFTFSNIIRAVCMLQILFGFVLLGFGIASSRAVPPIQLESAPPQDHIRHRKPQYNEHDFTPFRRWI